MPRRIAFDLAASVALVGILLQLARPGVPAPLGRLTPTMPVALVDRLAVEVSASGERLPIFNAQGWGGYVAYRLGDEFATYIDGRLETPTLETWNRYLAIANGAAEAPELLREDGIELALVASWQTGLHNHLTADGWRELLATDDGWLLQSPSRIS